MVCFSANVTTFFIDLLPKKKTSCWLYIKNWRATTIGLMGCFARQREMIPVYIAFYVLSLVRLLGCAPLYFIHVANHDTNKDGYFNSGVQYEEDIKTFCMSLAMIITCIERIPHFFRFGIFIIFAEIDLINSIIDGCLEMMIQNYYIPMIGENKIFFIFAVCISILFKFVHFTFGIIILIHPSSSSSSSSS